MAFQGQALSVTEMLRLGSVESDAALGVGVGVRHTAAANARDCQALLAANGSLEDCWRFGILQTLDDYTSAIRRGGVGLGEVVFAEEPILTGAPQIDAAFAALACHLARRDGWNAPDWVAGPFRQLSERWYPAVPSIFRAAADRESPPAFRERGVFITERSLARA